MSTFYSHFYAGGPYFMFPALFILIVIIILIVKGVLNLKNSNTKILTTLSSLGLFALVWGFFGQLLGLIQMLSYIQSVPETPPTVIIVAALRLTMYSTLFGAFIFLISRLGIITLTWLKKEKI